MSSTKLIKNFTSLSSVQIINYIFPLITIPYISRIIGPDGYGIINYATAYITYLTLIISYGFDFTSTRKITRIKDIKDGIINKIVSEVLLARIFLFFVSIIIFICFLFLFKPLNQNPFTAIVLFIGCIGTVLSPQYIYQGFQDLVIYAKVNFIKGIINVILVFILIKEPSDYIFLPILTSGFLIIINLSLFIYAVKKYKIKLQLIKIRDIIKLINTDKIVFFSTIVISLYTTTNVVVLGFFASKEDIGYYSTSLNLLNIANSIIAMPLSTALFPFIGKAFSKSREEGIRVVQKITPIIIYLTLLASLGILILAPYIIEIIFGDKFVNSIAPLRILSFLPFIIGLSNILGIQLMLNMGLDKLFLLTTSIASAIGVILNIFMSKYLGYIGTAWNCLIVEIIVTLIMYFTLLKKGINIISLENFKFSSIQKMFIKSDVK